MHFLLVPFLFLSLTLSSPITSVLLGDRIGLFLNARWLAQGLAGAHHRENSSATQTLYEEAQLVYQAPPHARFQVMDLKSNLHSHDRLTKS